MGNTKTKVIVKEEIYRHQNPVPKFAYRCKCCDYLITAEDPYIENEIVKSFVSYCPRCRLDMSFFYAPCCNADLKDLRKEYYSSIFSLKLLLRKNNHFKLCSNCKQLLIKSTWRYYYLGGHIFTGETQQIYCLRCKKTNNFLLVTQKYVSDNLGKTEKISDSEYIVEKINRRKQEYEHLSSCPQHNPGELLSRTSFKTNSTNLNSTNSNSTNKSNKNNKSPNTSTLNLPILVLPTYRDFAIPPTIFVP